MVKERTLLRVGRKQAPLYPYESLIPEATNTRDVGSSARQYHDAYIDGSGYIDAISISKNMIPEADSYTDLGSTSKELKNIYIDMTGFVDVLHIHNELRIPESATTAYSGLGTAFVLRGARPYMTFYLSGVATHIWASVAMHTGAKSW